MHKVAQKIFSISKFKTNYDIIKIISAQRKLSLAEDVRCREIDWAYMLSASSVLAQMDDGKSQDAALRVAQTCLSFKNDNETLQSAAAVILDMLSNNAAINLAIKRKLLQQNYKSSLPTPLRIDMTTREVKNSLVYDDGNEVMLNIFQREVFKLVEQNDRISISAPTSSGKSFLLLQLLLNAIKKNIARNIVYIVPTRALIQQVSSDANDLLKGHCSIPYEVSVIPVLKDQNVTKINVFVFTQERLQWLLNDYSNFVPDLLFVDEAQKISDNARGVILENVINEITNRNESVKIIFASPMSINPEKLLNYNISSKIKVGEYIGDYTAVNQNLLWVHGDTFRNTTSWKIDLCLDDEVVNIGCIETGKSTTVGNRIAHIASALSKESKGNLIFAHGKAEAEKISELLYDLESEENSLPKEILNLIDLIKTGIHKDYLLARVLTRRIAFHYGNMPQIIKTEIEELFKAGIIKYIVCTSTLIEGVNLPANTIFIRGIKKGKQSNLSQMDFWNLAGRAGRQGKEFQGNIVCIDSDDLSIWNGKPPLHRERYKISSSVESVIINETDNFINYINSNDASYILKSPGVFAHALTYILTEKLRTTNLMDSDFPQKYGSDRIISIDNAINSLLSKVSLSSEILAKNMGVHPISQQNLLNYFLEQKDSDLIDLIPVEVHNINAYSNYRKIITIISIYLTDDSTKLSSYRALLVCNWMRGYGLARIISDNINYHMRNDRNVNKACIIRNTMQDIEDYARFRFLKYISCYNAVLIQAFKMRNQIDLIDMIPNLNLQLEFGVSKQTQVSLMGLGLSRNTVILLDEYISNENLSPAECIKWLRNAALDSYNLNEINIREIKKMLNQHTD